MATTWKTEEIKNRLRSKIDNDPDNRYTTSDARNADDTDVVKPDTSPDEWEALWHYLDNAIHEIVEPEFRERHEATIGHSGGVTWSVPFLQPIPFDNDLHVDGNFHRPSGTTIEIERPGVYEISTMVSGETSGGDLSFEIFPQFSQDGGDTWNDFSNIRGFEYAPAGSIPSTASIPTFCYELNGGYWLRSMVRADAGNSPDFNTLNGHLSLTLVD